MSFLAEARRYVAVAVGRISLVEPHHCPNCRIWVRSISVRQFVDWDNARQQNPCSPPNLHHRCGMALRCAGPKPSTPRELIGEDR